MSAIPSGRAGWVRYAAVAVLGLAGLTGGYYLSGMHNEPNEPVPEQGGPQAKDAVLTTARFPLSALDVKEHAEAPDLAAGPDGGVILVLPSQTGSAEKTLLLSRSPDGGLTFPTPRAVVRSGIHYSVSQMRGKTVKRPMRMLPHAEIRGNVCYLSWTEALPDVSGVRTVLATSNDAGATFAAAAPVHRGAGGRSSYTSFAAGPKDTLACAWLDNRNGVQQTYASVRRGGSTQFDEEVLVHPGEHNRGVCPCCPTACLVGPDGTAYVAFRNVADGYRDIAIGILRPGRTKFDEPVAVVPPTWTFNGCPHDGPSLALLGETLHVVWMDAHTGSPRCYHGWAKLADMKFTTAPLHPIDVGSQGNAKLHVDGSGRLHTVWEESAAAPSAEDKGHQHEPDALGSGGRAIHYAMLGSDGSFIAARALAPRSDAFQTRPALAVTPAGRVVVAWNELDKAGKAIVVCSFEETGN